MTEILRNINWVDLLVVIVLIRSSYVGFTKGISWELFRLIGIICALVGAIYFYETSSQLVSDYVPLIYPFANLITFTFLYLLIFFISKVLNGLIGKIIKIEFLSAFERVGGFFIGVLRGGILLSFLLISLLLTPLPYFEKSIKERSRTGQTVSVIAPFLYDKIASFFPALKFEQKNEALIKLTGYVARPLIFEKAKKGITSHNSHNNNLKEATE